MCFLCTVWGCLSERQSGVPLLHLQEHLTCFPAWLIVSSLTTPHRLCFFVPLFIHLSLPAHFHITPSKPGLTFKANGQRVHPPILLTQQNGSEATKRKQNRLLWKILLGLGRCVRSVCFCSAHKHRWLFAVSLARQQRTTGNVLLPWAELSFLL